MRPIILSFLVLAACEGGVTVPEEGTEVGTLDSEEASTSEAHTDTPHSGCVATLAEISPAEGDTNVSVTKIVTAWFTAPVEDDEWALSVDGVDGTSELAPDGMSATFTSDAAYDTETSYTAEVEVCDVGASHTFTTAPGPLEASQFDGRTYAIDFDDLVWAQPPEAGALAANLDAEWILFSVLDYDAPTEIIEMAGALGIDDGDDVIQDPCEEAFVFDPADFSGNPVLEVGPAPLTVDDYTIHSSYFHVLFVEDGDAIEDIQISGQIDAAEQGLEAGCDLGLVTCTNCTHDPSNPYCVDVLLLADRGEWIDGLVFDPDVDPDSDAACN